MDYTFVCRQLYHHGDDVKVSFVVRNNSNKTVKKINVSVVQCIDIAMFTGGHHTARITQMETTEEREGRNEHMFE